MRFITTLLVSFMFFACSYPPVEVEVYRFPISIKKERQSKMIDQVFYCYHWAYNDENPICHFTDIHSRNIEYSQNWEERFYAGDSAFEWNHRHIDACKMKENDFTKILSQNQWKSVSIRFCSNYAVLASPLFKTDRLRHVLLYDNNPSENFAFQMEKFMKGKNFQLFLSLNFNGRKSLWEFLKLSENIPSLVGLRLKVNINNIKNLVYSSKVKNIRYLSIAILNELPFLDTKPIFIFSTRFPDLERFEIDFQGGYKNSYQEAYAYYSYLKKLKKLKSFRVERITLNVWDEKKDKYIKRQDMPLEKAVNLKVLKEWESENLSEFDSIPDPATEYLYIDSKTEPDIVGKRLAKFKNLKYLRLRDVSNKSKGLLVQEISKLKKLKRLDFFPLSWSGQLLEKIFKTPELIEVNTVFYGQNDVDIKNNGSIRVIALTNYNNTMNNPGVINLNLSENVNLDMLSIKNDANLDYSELKITGLSTVKRIHELRMTQQIVHIKDAGLKLNKNIKKISVENCEIPPDFYEDIISSSGIESFSFSKDHSREDIRFLKKFSCGTNLREFILTIDSGNLNELIPESVFQSLATCKSIEHIHLSGSFNDKFLDYLVKLPNIKRLYVKTRNKKTIEMLKKAFPKAKITSPIS